MVARFRRRVDRAFARGESEVEAGSWYTDELPRAGNPAGKAMAPSRAVPRSENGREGKLPMSSRLLVILRRRPVCLAVALLSLACLPCLFCDESRYSASEDDIDLIVRPEWGYLLSLDNIEWSPGKEARSFDWRERRFGFPATALAVAVDSDGRYWCAFLGLSQIAVNMTIAAIPASVVLLLLRCLPSRRNRTEAPRR